MAHQCVQVCIIVVKILLHQGNSFHLSVMLQASILSFCRYCHVITQWVLTTPLDCTCVCETWKMYNGVYMSIAILPWQVLRANRRTVVLISINCMNFICFLSSKGHIGSLLSSSLVCLVTFSTPHSLAHIHTTTASCHNRSQLAQDHWVIFTANNQHDVHRV